VLGIPDWVLAAAHDRRRHEDVLTDRDLRVRVRLAGHNRPPLLQLIPAQHLHVHLPELLLARLRRHLDCVVGGAWGKNDRRPSQEGGAA